MDVQKLKAFQLQGGLAHLTPWLGSLPLDPARGSAPDLVIGSCCRARHGDSAPIIPDLPPQPVHDWFQMIL